MHDALFESQGEWSGQQSAENTFKELAADLGLDQAAFDACLDGGTYAAKVASDYQDGVAEGVSSKTQFDLLKAMDCDQLQGYLFSPPVPAAEFEQLLDRETLL